MEFYFYRELLLLSNDRHSTNLIQLGIGLCGVETVAHTHTQTRRNEEHAEGISDYQRSENTRNHSQDAKQRSIQNGPQNAAFNLFRDMCVRAYLPVVSPNLDT